MKIILDTSVVLKWFVDEAGSDTAREYLENFIKGNHQLLIPTLLFYELGNACLQSSIPPQEISKIMELLQKLPFEIEDIGYIAFRKVYQNAFEYHLTYYDASYVTLMQKHNCELITADQRLFRKLKEIFEKIRLLKGISSFNRFYGRG
ncbi:type II toxin-antitoxin system VapC family toxin [Candidatus Gottesmanbacteria bacterium]|nr:type II toxin-antitoxin system VapC family toxin [Candidatus Gottesmanbacteria bacterium]MBI3305667.1 type II toxin-antitoxin system VapC family toxin [Candidatus Nomurabacteria bacterium]